jgi:hypothetical protein
MSAAQTVWQAANSPAGIAVIAAAFGAIWRWLSGKDKRVEKIGRIASQAFDLAEQLGVLQGLKGADKLQAYLQRVTESMQHQGLGTPTQAETERLLAIARVQALMVKDPPAPAGAGQ